MPNVFSTSDLVEVAAAEFKALNVLVGAGYRGDYANKFNKGSYKPGDKLSIKNDNFFVGSRGDTVTAEDFVESTYDLQIRPLYSVAIEYTPTDLKRKIEDFRRDIVRPAVRRLNAMIDKDIADLAKTQITHYTGDPASFLNSYESVDVINTLLDNMNANNYERYLATNPKNAQTLRAAATLQNSFLQVLNRDITLNARIGRLADLDMMKDNALSAHTSGTHTAAGDITVNAEVASGGSIVLAGVTVGATFKAGDRFTITGVKGWDRINGRPTDDDLTFVVQEDVTAASATPTITVLPSLIADGPRQNFFVEGADPNAIPAAAVVNFLSGTFLNNIAFTSRGLICVIPPLERMDSPESNVFTDATYGFSLRMSKTAEVLNNKNIMRLDAQAAFTFVPDQAAVLLSKAA